jgi:hypothetical protein
MGPEVLVGGGVLLASAGNLDEGALPRPLRDDVRDVEHAALHRERALDERRHRMPPARERRADLVSVLEHARSVAKRRKPE